MVWLNFGKSLLYTRFFLATLVRGPKDFTMFLQKVGGEESPWLPSTVSVTKVPELVEGPRTPSPRGTPPKTPIYPAHRLLGFSAVNCLAAFDAASLFYYYS